VEISGREPFNARYKRVRRPEPASQANDLTWRRDK
jgi:hypothetical protein